MPKKAVAVSRAQRLSEYDKLGLTIIGGGDDEMQKKRRLSWLSVLGLLAGFCLWFSLSMQAAADYDIDQYRVNVDIQRDGSANVTQAMTYQFDDDYHGVFNVQDLKGIRGAQLESVTTQLNSGPTTIATAGNTEANNTYQLTQNADRMRVKLYRQVQDDDELRVVYRYRLQGVVTNYADTAELNWKVIGSGWDVALDNVKIVIQLPAKNVSALQAWTHGPLSGQTKVDRAAGRVTMTLGHNPANQFVESHLLFPTTVTATNTRTSTVKRKATVQKQEAKLAQAANEKRRHNQLLRRGLFGVAVVVWLLVMIGYAWWLARHPAKRHQQPIPINHSFDVPPVAPAVAESLWAQKSPNTDALTAEILRAAANQELTIETVAGKRKPDVRLTQLKPVTNSFLAHCFDKVAVDGQFLLTDLKKYGKRDKAGRLGKWFSKWQTEVDQDVAVYQDEANYRLRNQWLMAANIVSIMGVIATGAGLLVSSKAVILMAVPAVVAAVVFWIGWLIQRRRIAINTDEGLELRNQINGLRRMLKDIGHFNTAQVGDLILWEQILPYAAAFGLADQVTKQLAIDFGTEALATGMLVYYPLFYANGGLDFDLSGAINDSFSGALDASGSASSSSGSSGGFSGGSSGGFGGGSGGGAF
ncbi:integral membrane protein [Lactiplantibacillus paraplantarum]|nr:integral membrane protein [Lactiplantibacillus paraplantarum]MCU4684646.1 DUF2207 domain-containing protein [Lactiplantibacillus paraplantarum]QJU51391.1 hypothetical protein CK401_02298 [Lactiplantibacillus paraplantarum]UKB40871.1 DUF2207 domain-containing protein [Lactiplantibacillus paraplantarum]